MARQMARIRRLSGNQSPQTLQVYPGGTQVALLVEAQQEVDECRRVQPGPSGVVQTVVGVRGEVQARESVSVMVYRSGCFLYAQ